MPDFWYLSIVLPDGKRQPLLCIFKHHLLSEISITFISAAKVC